MPLGTAVNWEVTKRGEHWKKCCSIKYGKVWRQGQGVNKSQQESRLNDRRNLISKIHKSAWEGSSRIDRKEVTVGVNIHLVIAP